VATAHPRSGLNRLASESRASSDVVADREGPAGSGLPAGEILDGLGGRTESTTTALESGEKWGGIAVRCSPSTSAPQGERGVDPESRRTGLGGESPGTASRGLVVERWIGNDFVQAGGETARLSVGAGRGRWRKA
jgi:hypothetical protein